MKNLTQVPAYIRDEKTGEYRILKRHLINEDYLRLFEHINYSLRGRRMYLRNHSVIGLLIRGLFDKSKKGYICLNTCEIVDTIPQMIKASKGLWKSHREISIWVPEKIYDAVDKLTNKL